MPRKQRPAKRQEESSFLTPDFLKRQKMVLEVELTSYQSSQKLAQQEMQIPFPDDSKADPLESAITSGEREAATLQFEKCGNTILQVVKALSLIDSLLAEIKGEKGGKKGEEKYGKCVKCKRLIPKKRLKAVPRAGRCTPCQELKDAEERRAGDK